ncbi:hypothetical protein [Cereibacter sediminicola]|uniref:hypothetical protein n=1 Tax=Cereibacter sediminicola TaxID=2584941 RepID=UPI0011A7C906|nr:hypothetical protein [Cereibacter sediminicola]
MAEVEAGKLCGTNMPIILDRLQRCDRRVMGRAPHGWERGLGLMTTLADTPTWLAAWQADNRERVEAGAKRAAEQAAQREARAAQRAARATSTPKHEANPKPRIAPAQRAQAAPVPKLVPPAGAKARLHEPQGFGHDLKEPEAWP